MATEDETQTDLPYERGGPVPVTPDGHGRTARDTTPQADDTPAIDEAISSISNYNFNPGESDEEALALLMMFSPRAAPQLPTLTTKEWPYKKNQRPNPVSIGKAKRLLATAYSDINCELIEAGVHGYAWIIEDDNAWLKRDGVTSVITPPVKPKKETDYDVKKQLEYNDKLNEFTMYHHLAQQGKAKIVEWFGESMFVDLYVNGMLPTTKTPKDLLQHISKTYAKGREHRTHLKAVQEEFDAAYDPRLPVETYFMKLQEACEDAELLGQPYTEQQRMNKALEQFQIQYGKDASKAEDKWEDKPDAERSWTNFKVYWKDALNKIESYTKKSKAANQAVQSQVDQLTESLNTIRLDMSALQAENRSYQEANSALARQIQFQQAMQTEQRIHSDDMSALTDLVTRIERAEASRSSGTGSTAGNTTTDTEEQQRKLTAARNRAPDTFKHLNGGKGKKFNKYCWKCGCNCSHWTRGCLELTDAQKAQYRDASFDNLLGGSKKFLGRRGMYQIDFNFDSL